MNSVELQLKITDVCKCAGFKDYDLMDIGCTLTLAMDEHQRNDLAAMIDFLYNQADFSFMAIEGNVFHDLNGLKAAYLKVPGYDVFLPRSYGYAEKVAKLVN